MVQGEQPVAQHTEAADHGGDAAAQHGQAPPHVELPPVLGEELNSVSNGGRITLLIPQGKSRPVDPKIASMFATACSAAVRDTVPILSHWKQYKGRHEIFSMYVAYLSVSFATHLTVHSMKKTFQFIPLMFIELKNALNFISGKIYFEPQRPLDSSSSSNEYQEPYLTKTLLPEGHLL